MANESMTQESTESAKYSNLAGLTTFWQKSKLYVNDIKSDLENKINALSLGMKLTASASPSIILPNTSKQITFTGSITNPGALGISKEGNTTTSSNSMYLIDGSEQLNMSFSSFSSNTEKHACKHSVKLEDGTSKTFTMKANIGGMEFIGTTTVYARNYIYYGMCEANPDNQYLPVSDWKTGTNKLISAHKTSAAGQAFTVSNDTNSILHFFLLVPTGVTLPSKFEFNATQVAVVKTEGVKYDGITYTVYRTKSQGYGKGVTLTIKT